MENREDIIKFNGTVHVQLVDEHGNTKQEHTDHNMIVTVGKSFLAAWLAANSQSGKFMSYIAAGTDTSASSAGMTGLVAELTGGGNSRVLGTLTSSANTWNNSASFGPGNCTGTITEVGLFSAITSGTMFARQTGFSYPKTPADTLFVSWTLTIS